MSGGSRVQDMLASVPLCTRAILGINVAVHAYVFISSAPLGDFAISPYLVIRELQFYRIVTSAFTHSGMLHILMNMMSLLQLGASLEHKFGTFAFFLLSLWSVVLCGSLYVLISWFLASPIIGMPGQMYSSAVGYSGVLFSYALIASYHTSAPQQSVFGLFNVPSKLYPWILLIILQFMLPGISLLGHLSGILVGVLAVYGALELLFLPSPEFCKKVDEYSCMSCISRLPSYKRSSGTAVSVISGSGSSAAGVCAALATPIAGIFSILGWVFTIVWGIVATVLHIVGVPSYITDGTACANIWTGIKKKASACWEGVASVFATRRTEVVSEDSPFNAEWSAASSSASSLPSAIGQPGGIALSMIPNALAPRGGQYARLQTSSPDPSEHNNTSAAASSSSALAPVPDIETGKAAPLGRDAANGGRKSPKAAQNTNKSTPSI